LAEVIRDEEILPYYPDGPQPFTRALISEKEKQEKQRWSCDDSIKVVVMVGVEELKAKEGKQPPQSENRKEMGSPLESTEEVQPC
jgi:hypothetical protein